jgi:hypothetical protein
VGFLWGSAAVSRSYGVSVWGSPRPRLVRSARHGVPRYCDFRILMTTFRVTQRHRRGLPAYGNFAHNE